MILSLNQPLRTRCLSLMLSAKSFIRMRSDATGDIVDLLLLVSDFVTSIADVDIRFFLAAGGDTEAGVPKSGDAVVDVVVLCMLNCCWFHQRGLAVFRHQLQIAQICQHFHWHFCSLQLVNFHSNDVGEDEETSIKDSVYLLCTYRVDDCTGILCHRHRKPISSA